MGGRGANSGLEKQKSQKIDFSGLPDLQGTEKQIAWAEDIRRNAINTINNNIERMEKENPKLFRYDIEAFKEIGESLRKVLTQPQGAKASLIIEKRSMFSGDRILRVKNEMVMKKRRNT